MRRAILPAAHLFICASLLAGTVSYEGSTFPDEQGWGRETSLLFADRFIEDGWLVQHAQTVPYEEYLIDEDDFYRRSISEFNGTDAFFIEWRAETDGPSTGFANVSPAVIVAGGLRGISYHFTIADDQVRLIRDSLLPLVFVDLAPGVPHSYRLELYGAELYFWWIDGQIVNAGIPEGTYPTADSRIVFGARSATVDDVTTVRWDFVRYGAVPLDGSGDYDSDGLLTLFDHYFVHDCLTKDGPGIFGGPESDSGPGCRFADFDSDGDTDLADLAAFQNAFAGVE